MRYIILTPEQATAIQAVVNSQPGGVLVEGWTINVLDGRLKNGNYAIQESIKQDLTDKGIKYQEAILEGTGIDVDALPVEDLTIENFIQDEL